MENGQSWSNSLLNHLARYADLKPSASALIFPTAAGPAVVLTWSELYDSARRLAARLARAGVVPGEIVAILSSSPSEQILGFLGVMACGGVPTVVSYPSAKQTSAQFLQMFRHVLETAHVGWLLCGNMMGHAPRNAIETSSATVRYIDFPDIAALTERADPGAARHGSPMFLQFSSGTTGLRKGIAISSAAFRAHTDAYSSVLGLQAERDNVVSWLPLYHDMGLIASCLTALDRGVLSIHMSPFDWLKDPVSIFRLATSHRSTFIWMPNFAYQLCATRISDEELSRGVDLRGIRAFLNAGEPVREQSLSMFHEKMRPVGVEREQLQVLYGMAENVMAATQTPLGRPPRIDVVERGALLRSNRAVPATQGSGIMTAAYVSCGTAIPGVAVRIAGATSDRQAGEIEITSRFMFDGYWQGTRPLTPDGWFATGDLGYLSEGELYVTGRIKDLIIQNGVNLPPNEIEEVVDEVDGVKDGRVVVFGVFNEKSGTEDIVAMLELEQGAPNAREVRRAAREQVQLRFGLALADVVVCGLGTLAKSTSGKLSRDRNRELFLSRGPAEHEAPTEKIGPRDQNEARLAQLWQKALASKLHDQERIGVRDLLFSELGVDSIATMEVLSAIHQSFGVELSPALLFQNETIEAQAALIRNRSRTSPILVAMRRGNPARNLFLVHDASGDTLSYLPLSRQISNDWSIYALQNPHAFGVEGMYQSAESMASDYVRAVQAVQPAGPYYLGGHSCGGSIAFEMAAQLQQTGHEVGAVILIDSYPPGELDAFDGSRIREEWKVAIEQLLSEATPKRDLTKIQSLLRRKIEIRLLNIVLMFDDLDTLCDAIELCIPEEFGEHSAPVAQEDRWAGIYARLSPYLVEWAWRARLYRGKTLSALRRARVVSRSVAVLVDYEPNRMTDFPVVLIKVADSGKSLGWQSYCSLPLTIHEVSVVDVPSDGTSHTHIITGKNVPGVAGKITALLETAASSKLPS